MQEKKIASIIQNMGLARLYSHESGYPKNNAQINLEGRNYFATDSTLKCFGCRINSAHETASGLLFYVIESSFLNYAKTARGFRFAVFDVFGEEVLRLDVAEAFKTSEQCRKAMYKALDAFDLPQHYIEKLTSIGKRAHQESLQAYGAIDQMKEEELAHAV
jgi:hypothetical protein